MMRKIIQNKYAQTIITLLVTVPPVVFFILSGGLWGFNNLVDLKSQLSILTLIIFILFCVFGFWLTYLLIKQIFKNPTYLFAIGILSLSFFLSWGFILAGGGVQDGLGIYFIVIPAIIGTSLVMLIDRFFVSKYGTKKVNKVERIIVAVLLILLIFQMISIRIQTAFLD